MRGLKGKDLKKKDNTLDAIIIGAGMGGLTAAGLLSAKGKRVMVLEKEDGPGGYVTGFRRKEFYFDATGAFLSACNPGGEFHQILGALGIADRLTFRPIGTVWNIYPQFDLRIDYQNPSVYLNAIKNRFPQFQDALEAYGNLTQDLGQEFLEFEKAPFWQKVLLPFYFPKLLRYARKSHSKILKRFFKGDPSMTLALSALPTTLPPSLLSYAFVAVLWAKVLNGGVFYPMGGMAALTEAMAAALNRHGGRIRYGCTVTRILSKGRRVTGVGLSDESEILAPWVISDMNPFQGEILLAKQRNLFGPIRSLQRYRPSLSALLFYVALPKDALPPQWTYFISINTTDDLETMAAALEHGSMENGLHMVVTTPTLMDPALAPPGHHSLKVLVHAPRADLFEKQYWSKEALDRLQDMVFTAIHKYTGLDIKEKALFVERATPMTLLSHTGNEGGAMYGLDAACGQVGPQRPPNRTSLDNLLWVGHYTHPAHGIVGSAMSGRFAANIILQKSGQGKP